MVNLKRKWKEINHFANFFIFFIFENKRGRNDKIFYKVEKKSEKKKYLQPRVRVYLGTLEWREKDSGKEDDLMLQEFQKSGIFTS
mgnify:CR=1 FL=1